MLLLLHQASAPSITSSAQDSAAILHQISTLLLHVLPDRSLGFQATNVHVGTTEADRAQTGPQLLQELRDATAAGEKVRPVQGCWAQEISACTAPHGC
jgi:hypothetical protein